MFEPIEEIVRMIEAKFHSEVGPGYNKSKEFYMWFGSEEKYGVRVEGRSTPMENFMQPQKNAGSHGSTSRGFEREG